MISVHGLDAATWADLGERLRTLDPQRYVEVLSRVHRLVVAVETFELICPADPPQQEIGKRAA
jgi:hypothetical protein